MLAKPLYYFGFKVILNEVLDEDTGCVNWERHADFALSNNLHLSHPNFDLTNVLCKLLSK